MRSLTTRPANLQKNFAINNRLCQTSTSTIDENSTVLLKVIFWTLVTLAKLHILQEHVFFSWSYLARKIIPLKTPALPASLLIGGLVVSNYTVIKFAATLLAASIMQAATMWSLLSSLSRKKIHRSEYFNSSRHKLSTWWKIWGARTYIDTSAANVMYAVWS